MCIIMARKLKIYIKRLYISFPLHNICIDLLCTTGVNGNTPYTHIQQQNYDTNIYALYVCM